jgi:CubicO group peptidase (beta-lactamase class C family)
VRTTALRYLTLAHILTVSTAFAAGTGDDEPATDRASPVHACPDRLAGAWHGTLPVAPLFDMQVTVVEDNGGDYTVTIRTQASEETVSGWTDGPYLRFQSATSPLSFRGTFSSDGERLEGFVQQGSSLVRIALTAIPSGGVRSWTLDWTPLVVPDEEVPFDLYVEEDGEGGIGGYFFFRDQRLPGLGGYGLKCEQGSITLGEIILGLEFSGVYEAASDRLLMDVVGPAGSTSLIFTRMSPEQVPPIPDAPEAPPRRLAEGAWSERAPVLLDDGWATATPSYVGLDTAVISNLIASVAGDELEYTHSILVARAGQLVLEEYFYGFDRETRHDMRSASKSVTSTLVGLAIQEERIAGSQAKALTYLPQYRWYDNWDDRKAEISIGDLLTMSSGLDARDWVPESIASEGAYQSQTDQPDWVKFALDVPMLWDPGLHVYYGGANPLILGGILASVVDEPVEWFAHRALFGPLGIDDYRFFLDPTGIPYMGGGMYMRPRDMLKYGQLYLDGGTWNGRRILSREWIEESLKKYGRLEPLDRNGQEYGYLWWHHVYEVGGDSIATVEARGNGGQYIFVVPSLEMVVVITSGNFRNGRLRQPEEIMGKWILPSAVGVNHGTGN